MASPKKPMHLAALIPLDIALIASCSLTFSYFHHVRPRTLENDPSKLQQAYIPENQYGTSQASSVQTITTLTSSLTELLSTTGTDYTIAATETGDITMSDGTAAETTAVTDETTPNDSNAESSVQSQSATVKTTASSTTTTTTTTAPQPDLSGWGYKWPDVFSLGNEVEITDMSYKSHNMSINIESRQVGDSVAYIADVYIRYIDNFQSAFANEEYGKNLIEWPRDIAERHNAVFAVNGDYYGIRDNGVIVRNYTLYRDTPRGELCGIFYDGTVRNYLKNDFDVADAMQNGLYQTMTFGPYLIMDDYVRTNIVSAVTETNPRTGFGYYEPGHYCFVVVDGRQEGYSMGLTLDEYAALFADLGCHSAYNLDGGQSSVMLLNGREINHPYNGGRATSDIFYLAEVN